MSDIQEVGSFNQKENESGDIIIKKSLLHKIWFFFDFIALVIVLLISISHISPFVSLVYDINHLGVMIELLIFTVVFFGYEIFIMYYKFKKSNLKKYLISLCLLVAVTAYELIYFLIAIIGKGTNNVGIITSFNEYVAVFDLLQFTLILIVFVLNFNDVKNFFKKISQY
ncbi:MAG: hypothetical protein LBC44_03145 [Mycoplasmataceae bacterium]|jgi:hypothetical protein|nr:hypothetical protein [Mycoplasmataceae bacterium]